MSRTTADAMEIFTKYTGRYKRKKKEGVLLSNHIRRRSGQDVTEYWFYISVKLLRKNK